MSRLSRRELLLGGAAAGLITGLPLRANAAFSAFTQAVAEAAASDREIATFYREAGFQPIWTGEGDIFANRRSALVTAMHSADVHGLPRGRFTEEGVRAVLSGIRSERDLGRAEVEMSRLYLRLARNLQTGVISPSAADGQIKREVPHRDRTALLRDMATSEPSAYMRALAPQSQEYANLLNEKLRLEQVVARGGWGPKVPGGKLEMGASGDSVVALRNRLIRMGYMPRTAQAVFDQRISRAVAAFQSDHGLVPDGVVGGETLNQINIPADYRLRAVMVAMERERWLNFPEGRGERHVWVNLPDFRTRLYDNGKITFETKSVIGEERPDKRTPEFSDMMEHMEINPDWTVPRSILGRDYLPVWRQNPFAKSYLQIIDRRGRVVPRQFVDFWSYSEKNFPYTVRQAPGPRNALGTVKFMFPNPYAIYLHDTPDRHLFEREVRDYSSGCIRLYDPHDFAYVLLRRQMSDPEPYFQDILRSGRQTTVKLETPIPVHLDYRTAFCEPKRKTQFRRDVYGRDAAVWGALDAAGVALQSRGA